MTTSNRDKNMRNKKMVVTLICITLVNAVISIMIPYHSTIYDFMVPVTLIIAAISFIVSLFLIRHGGLYVTYIYLILASYNIFASIGENLGRRGDSLNYGLIISISSTGLIVLVTCIFWILVKAYRRKQHKPD